MMWLTIYICKCDINVVILIFFHVLDDPFKDDPFGKADVAGMFSTLNPYVDLW